MPLTVTERERFGRAAVTMGGSESLIIEEPVYCLQGNGIDRALTASCNGKGWKEDASYTLNTIDRPAVAYSFDSLASNSMKSHNPNSGCREVEIAKTLDTTTPDPAKNQGGTCIVQVYAHYAVRRLTPLECERLQGLPDYYTLIPPNENPTDEQVSFYVEVWREWGEMNGKKPKTEKQVRKWLASEPTDGARYKMLGNGIALPPWKWVLGRMAEHLPENATCASLFDGTGSFPLIWESIHGEGTAVWSSEVDPEPIRVSQHRINGGKNGD